MDHVGNFLAWVWRDSSPLVESTLMLLILMFFWTLVEIVERGLRYRAAFRESRHFLQVAVGFLKKGDWDSVLALAERSKRSHVATVFASGLQEFRKARACTSTHRSVEVAARGARIASNHVHEQLRRGLNILGTIATTAPLIGLFGTVIGILNSFHGMGMNKATALAMIAFNIAEALLCTALGMLVAILTVWCFNRLSDRLSICDAEMQITSLELVKYLSQQPRSVADSPD
jgi:biopolymer transport protein ExbB/TolQ